MTPPVTDPAAVTPSLAAALGTADVAAVLARLAAADVRTQIEHARALAPLVQEGGAALLLDGLPDVTAHACADGAHLTGAEAFEAAVAVLKPDRIAGCGGLHSRHDAMVVAECGADYVMFGEPEDARHRPAFGAVLDRIAWWAEVFEVPCVGYAGSLDEVTPLAAAGADFVALGAWLFEHEKGPAAATADAASRLMLMKVAG